MIPALLDYLLHGSTELTLPQSWLANRERLAAYEAYTTAQLNQGSVVSDCAAMRRKAFWAAVEAKQQPVKPAIPFPQKARKQA